MTCSSTSLIVSLPFMLPIITPSVFLMLISNYHFMLQVFTWPTALVIPHFPPVTLSPAYQWLFIIHPMIFSLANSPMYFKKNQLCIS